MSLISSITKLAREIGARVLTDGINVLGTAANPIIVSQSSGTIAASSTLTTPVIAGGLTASGSGSNDFSGSTGTFKTSTGANTLGGDTSVSTKFTVASATGTVSKYNNETTAGVGTSYTLAVGQDVASSGAGAQTTAIATKTSPASGLYRVSIVMSANTNDDTVTADVSYTDAVESTATTLAVIASTALTHNSATVGTKSGSVLIRASAATSIIARITLSSQTTTKASAVIERLN